MIRHTPWVLSKFDSQLFCCKMCGVWLRNDFFDPPKKSPNFPWLEPHPKSCNKLMPEFPEIWGWCSLSRIPKALGCSSAVRVGLYSSVNATMNCDNWPWDFPIYHSLRIQSPCQMMIGVYNHLLSQVFRFHYHSQKVIGSLGIICG